MHRLFLHVLLGEIRGSTCDEEFGFVELFPLLDLFVPRMAHLCNFLSDYHLFLNHTACNLLDNMNDTLGLSSGV
jgi:hypothetical protein